MTKVYWAIFSWYFTIQQLLQTTRGDGPTVEQFECPSSQFTCKNLRCIPSSWRCDKDDDCSDGEAGGASSDEIDCAVTCSDDDQFRCDNGQCISSRWQCDRDTDCRDGSDEKPEYCVNKTCKEDQFRCGNGACIPKAWMCDGQTDCADDEADEKNEECTKVTCKEGEFACKNGRCIEERWMCDQDDDCYDKSDEDPKLCPVQSCEKDEFQCENKLCVKSSWVCDGDLDCKDGSDEKNCTSLISSKCSKTEFVCNKTLECIHMSWRCDGDADCSDESDELNCVITCREDQFMCVKESYCISDVLKCDGHSDCTDNSDEDGCPTQCKKDEFDCRGDGKKCIPMEKICDQQNDCGNFEDENPEKFNCKPDAVDPCDEHNGHCNQLCVNNHQGGYICECHPGYTLNSTIECVDINECNTPGTCSQICTNTKGGFKCSCEEGYTLDDGKRCRVTGKGPQLLLANRKDLRRIDIADQRKFDYSLLVKDDSVECAIAVDYDIRNSKVYWTDVSMEKILSADIDDNTTVTTVADTLVNTPDGIAVDWIHKHLYWTDTGYNKIEVSSLDGKMRKVLIDSNLDEPRAIVLDPSNGYMYWTDWGENPKIEKCGMDGSNRKVIIQNQLNSVIIQWPNGITIDFVNQRLLWLDAKLHKIVSSDYEGNDLRMVLSSHADVHHPFGIAVFEDFIYYSDWKSNSVWKMNKFGVGKPSEVALDLNRPSDVHIFHEYKQPMSARSNRCPTDHGCQHFCLPSPTTAKYSCVCQNDYQLYTNKKSCTEIPNKSSLPKPTVEQKPDSPNKSKHVRAWIRTETAETAETVKVQPHVVSTDSNKLNVVIPHEATTDSGYEIVTSTENNTEKSAPISKPEEENIGQIAGIVIAAIAGVAILVGIVIFVLLKRLRRKNMKSMNFDNPVYRKTTEEQFAIDKANKLPPSMQPLNPPTNEIV